MLNMNLTKEEYFSKVRLMTDHAKKNILKRKNSNNEHLDHIVPISFGYDNDIPPEILSLPENLQYISELSNLKKGGTLTKESINLLKNWISEGKIDSKFNYYVEQEIAYENALHKYDFSQMYEIINKTGFYAIYDLPAEIAYSFVPIFCQRRHDLRWEKTRKSLGHICLPTHRMMTCVVYPDGRIERVDGNTRSYIFSNNLQFKDYDPPKTWFVTFIPVENEKQAEQIYHSIDSTEAAETFSEKVSGYMFNKKYHIDLPTQFQKGERVYDIAVIAVDGFVPPNEKKEIAINTADGWAEKAKSTVEVLDYFIEEFVTLGGMLQSMQYGDKSIPRQITSPLMGMMIRYLMVDKTKKCENLIKNIIYECLDKDRGTFFRTQRMDPIKRNIRIMLDELKTSEETFKKINPFITYRSTTTRCIIPDYATKTTINTADRRIYCGWIAYCMDKCLAGEEIDEDILLDVTGKKITDDSRSIDHDSAKKEAKSILMTKYDQFWKTH